MSEYQQQFCAVPRWAVDKYLLLAVDVQLSAVHQSGGCFSQRLKLLLCKLLLLSTEFDLRLHLSIALSCRGSTPAIRCVQSYHITACKLAAVWQEQLALTVLLCQHKASLTSCRVLRQGAKAKTIAKYSHSCVILKSYGALGLRICGNQQQQTLQQSNIWLWAAHLAATQPRALVTTRAALHAGTAHTNTQTCRALVLLAQPLQSSGDRLSWQQDGSNVSLQGSCLWLRHLWSFLCCSHSALPIQDLLSHFLTYHRSCMHVKRVRHDAGGTPC